MKGYFCISNDIVVIPDHYHITRVMGSDSCTVYVLYVTLNPIVKLNKESMRVWHYNSFSYYNRA